MRSKLFVPASRPDLFETALGGPADALSFDLEDAVPEEGKAAARAALGALLRDPRVRAHGKMLIVRVNAADTPHFAADVAALDGCAVDLVNLPKADRPADVARAAAALDGAGLAARLLITIESAAGLAAAAAIAAAHPRVAGLQVGLNDLFAQLSVQRGDPRHVHAALWQIRLACGQAGVFAYDGAWPDIADEAGFRAEAQLARSLGFAGKSCIHPRQVPICNAIFDDGDSLAAAKRLLAAAAVAEAEGRGAFLLDGRMVDRPMIEQARALVAERQA